MHLSAVGVDREAPTKFSQTKLAGDRALMKRDLGWVILRPSVAYFVELAGKMGPKDASEAAKRSAPCMRRSTSACSGIGYRALITPTVATTEVAADYNPTSDRMAINGKTVDPHLAVAVQPVELDAGPSTCRPVSPRNKVPTGMQIAVQSYDDLTAAAIATAYEKAAAPLFVGNTFP